MWRQLRTDFMVQNHVTDIGRSVQKSVTDSVSASFSTRQLTDLETISRHIHHSHHHRSHRPPIINNPTHLVLFSRQLHPTPRFLPLHRLSRQFRPFQPDFPDSAKMGVVSMNFGISEFRESPLVSIPAGTSSNSLSESRRQFQSELRPHQISHPGVTPHSRNPGSDGYGWMNPVPSSTTLLCHSLGQDGAVLSGFQQDFETLAPVIRVGTTRQARTCTSDFDAALILHERFEKLKQKVRLGKSVADQLVQAAAARPRKHRARYLNAQFQGPTARKDVEDSERNRWTTELAERQSSQTSSEAPSRR